MFGYIKEYTPELKIKDHMLDRALYCGLCRAMGKCTGQCSRFALSYDAVFLILIRDAVTGTVPECEKKRCFLHPFHRRNMAKENEQIRYAARASALITDGVLHDKINDGKGIKKLGCRILLPFSSHAFQKADLPGLASALNGHLADLDVIEKQNEAALDKAADIFGAYLSDIFGEGLTGGEKHIAEAIGYHTGRYIYITDALDDYKKDISGGTYNPLTTCFGREMSDEDRESVHSGLLHELNEIASALDLITFPDAGQKALIENIVFEQMKRTADHVCQGTSEENKKR